METFPKGGFGIMGKHAYLVLAHNNFDQLGRLLAILDDDRNDIYIHIDRKAAFSDADRKKLLSFVKKSVVFFVPRVRVSWGGYSQIESELSLLTEATKKTYDYCHLISGADLPVKSQDYIHRYFDDHPGIEYVHFGAAEWIKSAQSRVKYHWMFQETVGHSQKLGMNILKVISRVYVKVQKLAKVDRMKKNWQDLKFAAGSNWFSITGEFARYIVENTNQIKTLFSDTICGDEEFVQVLALNSRFYSRCFHKEFDGDYESVLRLIDWKRGRPYVWRKEDFNELTNTPCIFARKFDENIDSSIISLIEEHVKRGTVVGK